MATERATNQIPIEDFDQEIHDPDEYFERFDSAIELATGVTDADRKSALNKKWLPMKLNAAARMILKSCNNAAAWDALITEFKGKLITPQDKYNWRSGKRRITWDGRESFHVLSERVKRTVDRYEDQPREKDYFYEFRQALPKNYRQAIDFGSEGVETLETAKKIALKLQAAISGSDADESSEVVGGKSVSFVGGSMTEDRRQSVSEDRLKTMEMGIQKLTVSMENQATEIAKLVKERVLERARSKTPDQVVGAQGGDSRQRESPERDARRYDSRERFKTRYQDQDRFADDNHVSSLGRGQRDPYVRPGPEYSRPFGDRDYASGYPNRGRQEERSQGYGNARGAYGSSSGYNQGGRGSPNRGQRFSPNRGRGFSPNQGRSFSPNSNSNRNRPPSGPQQNYLGQFGLQAGCYSEQSHQPQYPPPGYQQHHAPPVSHHWQGGPYHSQGSGDRVDGRPLPPSAPSTSQLPWGWDDRRDAAPEGAYASQWDWRDPKNY